MNIANYIWRIKATNSTIKKQNILVEAISNFPSDFVDCLCLLSSNYSFGISSVSPVADTDGTGDPFLFLELIKPVVDHQYTGNALREYIEQISTKFYADDWNLFYSKIIEKNLDCGLGIVSINKALESLNHPARIWTYNVQLASQLAENSAFQLKGEYYIEPKLDGVRCIAYVESGRPVILYSRNGKEITNFPHINNALKNSGISGVFDGELISSNGFQDIMKNIFRKNDVTFDNVEYHIFDKIDDTDQFERKNSLDKIAHCLSYPIQMVEYKTFDMDTEQSLANDYCQKLVRLGYEGAMFKRTRNAFYENKRSKNWLKYKPVIEVSLLINDVVEGTGKYEGTCGALKCSGIDDITQSPISVHVGTGLSDDDRKFFWENRQNILGSVVEISADALTKAQDSDMYSLRFPRFKVLRGFNKEKM